MKVSSKIVLCCVALLLATSADAKRNKKNKEEEVPEAPQILESAPKVAEEILETVETFLNEDEEVHVPYSEQHHERVRESDKVLAFIEDHQWVIGAGLIGAGAPIAVAGVALFAYVVVTTGVLFVFSLTWIILETTEMGDTTMMLLIALPITILYGIIATIAMKRKAHWGVGKLVGFAGAAVGYIAGAIIDIHFLNEETFNFDDPSATVQEIREFHAEHGEQWPKILGVAIGAVTGVVLGLRFRDSSVLVCSSFLGSLMVSKGLSTFFWTQHWPTFSKALNAEFAESTTEFWVFTGIFFGVWVLGLLIQFSQCPKNALFHKDEEEA